MKCNGEEEMCRKWKYVSKLCTGTWLLLTNLRKIKSLPVLKPMNPVLSKYLVYNPVRFYF